MAGDQNQKKDAGKVPLELLDFEAVEGIARVLGFGARKYKAHGWRAGMEWSRLIGAALRHLFAMARGEDIDPESGLPHIDHLGCCWMFLSAYQKQKLGTDDRYRPAAPTTTTRTPSPLIPRAELGIRPNAERFSFDANGAPLPHPDSSVATVSERGVTFENMPTMVHPCAAVINGPAQPPELCANPMCQICY